MCCPNHCVSSASLVPQSSVLERVPHSPPQEDSASLLAPPTRLDSPCDCIHPQTWLSTSCPSVLPALTWLLAFVSGPSNTKHPEWNPILPLTCSYLPSISSSDFILVSSKLFSGLISRVLIGKFRSHYVILHHKLFQWFPQCNNKYPTPEMNIILYVNSIST